MCLHLETVVDHPWVLGMEPSSAMETIANFPDSTQPSVGEAAALQLSSMF